MGYKQPVPRGLRLDDTVNQPVRRMMAPVGGPTVQECARQNGRPAGLLPREDDFEVALAEFLDCTSQRAYRGAMIRLAKHTQTRR